MSKPTLIRLLLLGAILAVFGRCLLNDFVLWDDSELIYKNVNLQPPFTLDKMLKHWNPHENRNMNMYNPLVYTTWWGIAHVAWLQTPDVLGAQMNPQIFHAFNLLVHWLTCCVVLEILRRLRLPLWASVFGTLLFAVHPLQTESVVWATAMKDLLSGLLALLALWRYLVAAESTNKKFSRNYIAASVFFLLALLSKPSTVVVPLIAALADRLVYHADWKKIALRLSPWLVVSVAVMLLTRSVQSVKDLPPVPIYMRPAVAADALAFYLFKLVVPIHLSFDNGRNPQALMHDAAFHFPLYWTWIFPVVVALILWRSRKPLLQFAGGIFVLGLLPVLGFLPFIFQFYSTVADRYVYLSMLGPAIVAAWLLARFTKPGLIAASSAALIILGALSFVQAGVWHDTATLYANALRLNHTNYLHYAILGEYYDHLGNFAEDNVQDRMNSGDTAGAVTETQNANNDYRHAVEMFRQGLQYNPLVPNLYTTQVKDLIQLERYDEAIAMDRQLIQIQPRLPAKARQDMAPFHAQIALLCLKTGRMDDAARELRDNPSAISGLRDILQKQTDPAAAQYRSWLDQSFPRTQPTTR